MKKIIFISHDATLTGAPILLLNLINSLQLTGNFLIKIIIKNNIGILQNDFERIAEVLYFNMGIAKKKRHIGNILSSTKNRNYNKIKNCLDEADIIFSNTITNGDLFNCFGISKEKKVFTYVHELQIAANYYTNEKDIKKVLETTTYFCVPSEAVKKFLEKHYKIRSEKIKQLNYYIPVNKNLAENIQKQQDIFIVGIIGTLDWRKGAELLPVIIVNLFNKYPGIDVQFLWKGSNKQSLEYKRIVYELEKTEYAEKVIFEEPSKDKSAFYETIDILLLCSKEDPYPLVVLEAAAFKKPCVCFDKAGGASEFVQGGAGFVVPFLDINELTDAVYALYSNKDMRNDKGEVAYKRFLERHYNTSLIQSQFEQLLN